MVSEDCFRRLFVKNEALKLCIRPELSVEGKAFIRHADSLDFNPREGLALR
ncbi:hypothetical protein AAJCM20276_32300 [Acetobacter aceti]|uniref:Uncharacterized protein n=1 Tax=Acetobacter aceti TaxID=435 RepID=A0A6S6PPA2_ACEAC|nr:hypothetical protein AAJCM20276_32300 [Acetobacter aceti]